MQAVEPAKVMMKTLVKEESRCTVEVVFVGEWEPVGPASDCCRLPVAFLSRSKIEFDGLM